MTSPVGNLSNGAGVVFAKCIDKLIRQYIIDNPINWKTDRDNLENLRKLTPAEKVDDYLEELAPEMES